MFARRPYAWPMILFGVSVVALACSGGTYEQPVLRSAAPAPEAHLEQADPVTLEPVTPEAEAEVPEPMQVFHDLREDPALYLRHGNQALVDLGTPRGAGASLGGWGTGTREVTLDGTTAVVARSTTMRLIVPIDDSAVDRLRVRLRSFRPTPVTAYLDGEVLGHFDATTEFGVHDVQISRSVVPGDHLLMFRARRRGTSPGLGSVSLAVDWVSLGAGDPEAPVPFPRSAEPTPETPAAAVYEIPAGWTAEVYGLVPEGGLLQLAMSGEVQLEIAADGLEPYRASVTSGRVPLDAFVGRIVRFRLTAGEQDQTVHELQVVQAPTTRHEIGRPRNVLLVLIDTLRADKLSPYAPDTRVQTPRLVEFLRTATIFDHAHSQENWTKPSVATLLTSLMPWEHTATEHSSVLPRSVVMLPEVLKDHGFQTASFICNGFVSDRFGFRQGWDSYRNYIREGRRTRSQFVASDVLEWLDGRDEEKPFFLYVHTIDPHVPYRAPDEFLAMYGDTDYRGVVNFRRDATLLENIKLGNLRLAPRDREHLRALYDAEISYHDRHFGSILAGLESRGLMDDTLVVITSDHGEEFWDHGSVGHGHSVYEELLHVPMFVRVPGEAPQRVTTPVGLVDVMPTILEALDLPVPDHLSGRSFLGSLQGRPGRPRGSVSGFMENWRTFTVGRWKLIERPRNRSAVYDLQEDPNEDGPLEHYGITRRALRSWMGQRLVETAATRSRASGATRPRAEQTRIDAETAAQLRAIGYVE